MMITANGTIKIDDAELDRLGEYYRKNKVEEKTLLSFQQFLNLYVRGRWHERVV